MSGDGTAAGLAADAYGELRPLMFSIAYRMLGSVGDAEDIVQEAFLRYHQAVRDGGTVGSPRAFLATVTARLAIDSLRSARSRREAYVGPWLPEPLLADPAADPARQAADADSLSMAFLLVLERLNPVERAVFLLHEVFGYGYREVAGIVGKSESNCRQLAARARRHVSDSKPRFEVSRAEQEELVSRFFAALSGGGVDALASLLADDIVIYGDSGGVPPSWPGPIAGVARVARLLHALARQIRDYGARVERAEVNGGPGAVLHDPHGGILGVLSLEMTAGRVRVIRSVVNPAKLGHLGKVTPLREAAGRRRDEFSAPRRIAGNQSPVTDV
jgi:RNA polymerase sigma-70 factor, ECF subfamily